MSVSSFAYGTFSAAAGEWWTDIINPFSFGTVSDSGLDPPGLFPLVSVGFWSDQYGKKYQKLTGGQPGTWVNVGDWLIDSTSYATNDFEFFWDTITGSPTGGYATDTWVSWTSPVTSTTWSLTRSTYGSLSCSANILIREKGVAKNSYPSFYVNLTVSYTT